MEEELIAMWEKLRDIRKNQEKDPDCRESDACLCNGCVIGWKLDHAVDAIGEVLDWIGESNANR